MNLDCIEGLNEQEILSLYDSVVIYNEKISDNMTCTGSFGCCGGYNWSTSCISACQTRLIQTYPNAVCGSSNDSRTIDSCISQNGYCGNFGGCTASSANCS